MNSHSVTILGSTGSIGQNTLDVIARHPDRFRVEALTAHKNVSLLFRQCQQFKPRYAVISDKTHALQLTEKLKSEKINMAQMPSRNWQVIQDPLL